MRVTKTQDGVELWFPPFRGLAAAIALGAFGAIATAIGLVGVNALMPAAGGHTGGIMSAALLVSFVLPFVVFGAGFVLLALYMALNGLFVRVSRDAIETQRTLFGVAFARKRIAAAEIASIEPQIASRDQSLFSAAPIFRLNALDAPRTRRIVVAETLEGEESMQGTKRLIEEIVGRAGDTPPAGAGAPHREQT